MWEMKKLGDVCKTAAGGTPLKSNKSFYDSGNVPWLLSGEVANKNIIKTKKFITKAGLDRSSAKIFPKNTVLIAMYGATAGEVGILKCEASTNQAVCGVYPNDKYIPEYLYYFFLRFKTNLVAQAVGNAQPNISQEKIKNTKIPFPPLKTQKAIVAKLDTAFAELDKLKQNTEQNLKNARELFNSYLNNIFTAKGDDWVEAKLGDVCKVTAGQSPESKYYNTESIGTPFYQGKKEYGEKYLKKPIKWTTKVTKLAGEGDILMSVRAPVGPINIATQKICIGRGLAAIKALNINLSFLYYFLLSQQKKIVGNDGAVFNSINKTQIKNIQIPLPPLKTQQAIVKKLDNLANEVKQLEAIYNQKLKEIAELKQSILEQAFSGKLSI